MLYTLLFHSLVIIERLICCSYLPNAGRLMTSNHIDEATKKKCLG